MSAKFIEVVIDPQGKPTITTRGFAGGECRDASEYLEQALGARASETLTAEFYRPNNTGQNLTQGQ